MPTNFSNHERVSAVVFATIAFNSSIGNIPLPGFYLNLKLFDYDIVLATFLESYEGDQDVGLDRDD